LKGGALLALSLDSLTVQGAKYSIETSQFEQAGKGRGKRTAVGAGSGAAFGAIVGALAGGGKGAAIGALAGGGAGTAGAAYTGKRDITLPAETRLHFKLRNPVSISQ
jgi:outer membrane lipoprotein SlyB